MTGAMTEVAWLALDDPGPMLTWINRACHPSPERARKLRLYACACVEVVRSQLGVPADIALRAAYDHADGGDEAPLRAARALFELEQVSLGGLEQGPLGGPPSLSRLVGPVPVGGRTAYQVPDWALLRLCDPVATPDTAWAIGRGLDRVTAPARRGQTVRLCPPARQAELLREVIGNPFRPALPLSALPQGWRGEGGPPELIWSPAGTQETVPVAWVLPEWLQAQDGLVARLAAAIYAQGRWYEVPLLADALLDVGCDCEELIQHCRRPEGHVRGCWAVDVLLQAAGRAPWEARRPAGATGMSAPG